jgi:hypothetical protein
MTTGAKPVCEKELSTLTPIYLSDTRLIIFSETESSDRLTETMIA